MIAAVEFRAIDLFVIGPFAFQRWPVSRTKHTGWGEDREP